MKQIKRACFYIKHNPGYFFDAIIRRFLYFLPDKLYLSLRYRCQMGHWISWKDPKLFTEKIQWLKIYNRKPEYIIMVDKYAVKKYVAERIGEEYVIPTLGVWDSFEDIEINSLPKQFVLKTTHGGGSGGIVICKDKAMLDVRMASIKLDLHSDIYKVYREWPYKNVRRRIIAEEFIPNPDGSDLTDYKFFCFNGHAKYCQVIKDRTSYETIDFFNDKWEHQEFIGLNPKASNAKKTILCPINYEKMVEISNKLSEGIPFARIDLYNVNGKIYFGEITFFPASGFGRFSPVEYDYILGNLLRLPQRN